MGKTKSILIRFSIKEKKIMKAFRFLISIFFLSIGFTTIFTSCKYDVAEPMWDRDFVAPPTPKITGVLPAAGVAGVSTIKISGENFVGTSDAMVVYFDNVQADVISSDNSTIVVRRPNLVKDSSTIKIVPNKALVVAKYGPYKLEKVIDKYGSFLENLPLGAIAVDKSENLYVIETNSSNIYKVTPAGVKSILGTTTRTASDSKFGPDGKLYVAENHRIVEVVDVNSKTVQQWMRMPPGYIVKSCDFDSNGNFFAAGFGTDVIAVGTDGVAKTYSNGDYSNGDYYNSDVYALRVFKGYLYVAEQTSSGGSFKISKSKINADGTLAAKELVLDLALSKDFSKETITGITFSSTGTMYLAVDSKTSIIVVEPGTNKLDYLYRNILFPYCKQFYWGTGNYLYMISGDSAAPQEWTVYRVNMGAKGAPYF